MFFVLFSFSCISVKIQESTVQGLIPFLPMQICCCGWVGREKRELMAPFTSFRRSMVYIALCWYSSILLSKNVCLFFLLSKYDIYTHIHILKRNIQRLVYAFVMTKKEEPLLKTNKRVVWHYVVVCWRLGEIRHRRAEFRAEPGEGLLPLELLPAGSSRVFSTLVRKKRWLAPSQLETRSIASDEWVKRSLFGSQTNFLSPPLTLLFSLCLEAAGQRNLFQNATTAQRRMWHKGHGRREVKLDCSKLQCWPGEGTVLSPKNIYIYITGAKKKPMNVHAVIVAWDAALILKKTWVKKQPEECVYVRVWWIFKFCCSRQSFITKRKDKLLSDCGCSENFSENSRLWSPPAQMHLEGAKVTVISIQQWHGKNQKRCVIGLSALKSRTAPPTTHFCSSSIQPIQRIFAAVTSNTASSAKIQTYFSTSGSFV